MAMIWRTVPHVTLLCLALAAPVALAALTDSQKEQIVKLHNQFRGSVDPKAANMQRMNWDNNLSDVAAQYAATCRWDHNPYVPGVLGENLFLTLGPLIISQPLNLWYNEKQNYNFSNNSCAAGKLCGHYTQMVWANTTFVGCASHFCSNVSNFDAENATILVCNYYPPGNIIGMAPYVEGASCAACPSGTITCTDNYCDLGTNMSVASTVNNITALVALANYTLNVANNVTAGGATGSAAGFARPSAAASLLAALTAFYVRTT